MNSGIRSQELEAKGWKSGARSQKPEARSQKPGYSIQNPESRIRFHPSSLIPHPSPRRAAFTLIEIMVVIVIIMILVGIVVGTAKYAQTKAARSRAQAEIAVMEAALEQYKNDNGTYPLSTATRNSPTPPGVPTAIEINNSSSLYAALTTPKVYMTFKPNQIATKSGITYIADPFGSPYNYYCNPGAADQVNGPTFDLWSYGPDGMIGVVAGVDHDADNITNWKQ